METEDTFFVPISFHNTKSEVLIQKFFIKHL